MVCLLLILMLFPLPSVGAEDMTYTVFYVATTGSDTNDGSFHTPFATLQKAVNAAAKKENAIIKIRGGRYPMTAAIKLNANHNGLTIENYKDETVVLTGTREIPFSAFTKVTDQAILDRIIEQDGKDKVMQVSLADVGITDWSGPTLQGFGAGSSFPPILVWKDELLRFAEYPNQGYVYSETVLQNGSSGTYWNGVYQCEFTVNSDRWKLWKKAPDIWSLGFLCHDWADVSSPTTITEKDTLTAYVRSSYLAVPNRRIRFFNLLEELDVPNEYYVDQETGIMYLIPPTGITKEDSLSYTTYNALFFSLSSAKNITIKGLRMEGTRSNAVYLGSCTDTVIDNCEITAIGNTAVRFNSCTNSGIKNSSLHELLSAGVYFNCGNRTKLTSSNCYAENCKFKTFSQYMRTYCPAVKAEGVGIRVAHNEFSDSPHFAVSYTANNCIFEYNDFYNICHDTSDAGVIYTGRHWETRGNIIRYNYFHELSAIETTTGMKMNAVYLDDMHSSTQVYGNVFYKTSAVALFGGGRYNTFENNLMLECEYPFRFDSRGLDWMGSGEGSQIRNNLKRMPYTTGIWAETYPELVNILNDEPEKPKYNTIRNNVRYKTKPLNIDQVVKDTGTVEDAVQITNTDSFVDYASKNFNLKANSEIKKLIPDWQDIPFDQIGRYEGTEETRDERPSATEVSIKGTGVSGQTLTASYTYNGKGFEEGNTAFTWYILDGNSYRAIEGANKSTYTPAVSQRGKKIRVTVTPINIEGTSGAPVRSSTLTITRPSASEILTVQGQEKGVSISNTDSQSVSVTAVYPTYETVGQSRMLTKIITEQKTILSGGTVSFSETEGIKPLLYCSDNLEPILF